MRPLLIALVLFSSQSLFAADTGPLPLSVVSQDGVGAAWDVPGSGAVASCTSGGGFSQFLRLSADFGVVPVGATVTGIEVRLEKSASGLDVYDAIPVFVVVGGVQVGSGLPTAAPEWLASPAVSTYGGPGDLGGSSVSADDLRGGLVAFDVRVSFDGGSATAVLGVSSVTVYYTPATVADVEWWERSDCLLCWLLAMLLGVHLFGVSCRFRSNKVGRGLV